MVVMAILVTSKRSVWIRLRGFGQAVLQCGTDTVTFDLTATGHARTFNFGTWAKREFIITPKDSSSIITGLTCDCNELTKLDVSDLKDLTALFCHNNQLSELIFNKNHVSLGTLVCYGNKLTSLNVSELTNLVHLVCHNNQLQTLGVAGLTKLEYLNCMHNKLSGTALNNLFNALPSAPSGILAQLYVKDNPGTTGTELCNPTIATNKRWMIDYVPLKKPTITLTTLAGTWSVSVILKGSGPISINWGDGTSDNYSLSTNDCICTHTYTDATVHQIEITSDILTFLNCSYNAFTDIDVSKNPSIETLYCQSSQLTRLNASGLVKLKSLYCSDNKLTALNVNGNTILEALYCQNNQLTSLDASGLTKLKSLFCYFNKLSSLGVSGNISLEILNCEGNQLTRLDISGLAKLKSLCCRDNNLTNFTVLTNSNMIVSLNYEP